VRSLICDKRLRGCCPHPRAPGALALSLDRERDLEATGRGIGNGHGDESKNRKLSFYLPRCARLRTDFLTQLADSPARFASLTWRQTPLLGLNPESRPSGAVRASQTP
jgi:hypothetical protein